MHKSIRSKPRQGAAYWGARGIAVSGLDVEPEVQGTGVPHGEIDRQYLDPTAMHRELGWSPRWGFNDGLRVTWEWYERTLGGS